MLLSGMGLGGSSFYLREYTDKYSGFTAAPRGVIGLLADRGIVGFLLLVVPLGMTFAGLLGTVRGRPDRQLLIPSAIYITHGIIQWFTTTHWHLPWVVVGTLTGLSRALRAESGSPVPAGPEKTG
jgi:O-antigen ligase